MSSLLVLYLVIIQRSQFGAKHSNGLSDSCRAAIAHTLARIRSTDRGSTRERNYGTALSRADYFIKWGKIVSFSYFSFEFDIQEETSQVLSAYAQ